MSQYTTLSQSEAIASVTVDTGGGAPSYKARRNFGAVTRTATGEYTLVMNVPSGKVPTDTGAIFVSLREGKGMIRAVFSTSGSNQTVVVNQYDDTGTGADIGDFDIEVKRIFDVPAG